MSSGRGSAPPVEPCGFPIRGSKLLRPFLLKTSIDTAEAISYVNELINNVGWANLSEKVRRISNDAQKNPFAHEYLESKYSQEISLYRCKRRIRSGKKIGLESHDAVTFASAYVQMFNRLRKTGQRNIKGKLTSGVKSDPNGLAPLRFELLTAIHFSQIGIKLSCNDYDGGRGFDFMGEISGHAIEIECKYVSEDKGRKIPMRDVIDFAKSLKNSYLPQLDLFIDVEIVDRFPTDINKKYALFDAICSYVISQEYCNDHIRSINVFEIHRNIKDKLINEGTMRVNDVIRSIASTEYGLNNTQIVAIIENTRSVFVSFRSAVPDNHVEAIYRDLKDAAKRQLSGKRAGILCVYLSGINADEMNGLRNYDNKLMAMSCRLLNDYPHIIQIIYCSKQEVIEKITTLPATKHTVWTGSAATYTFENSRHPLNGKFDLLSRSSQSPDNHLSFI